MSLSDLASLGSFVSGVAVLISLVYLALQVRQAEKNQRAMIQQGRADRDADQALRLAEPALGTIWAKGVVAPENLSSVEIDLFMQACIASFLSAEDSFLQHRAGLLDQSAYGAFVTGWEFKARLPGIRVAWQGAKHLYGAQFVTFMDELTRRAPPSLWSSEAAKLDHWRATVRSVNSGG
jgi:hypothetical protein